MAAARANPLRQSAKERPSGATNERTAGPASMLLGARPERIIDSTLRGLADLLPGVGAAQLIDSFVTKERRATFRARPGTAPLRPPAATRHPTLTVAGAWTATGWPATMEGAVRSGLAAAQHLIAEPRPFIRTPMSLEVA